MQAPTATRRAAAAIGALAVVTAWALAPTAAPAREPVGVDAKAPHAAHPRATRATAPPADLDARAYVVMLEGSGRVIASLNAGEELPIASTTKLMTAYVTLQREPLDKVLVEQPYVPSEEAESLAPVPAGARLSVPDMLRAMLLPSGNNVAYSLAVDVGASTSAFVGLMNEAALKLGLGRTHYTTPIGLDTPPGNYSTAVDLARLARVLMRNKTVREIVDEPRAELADGVVVYNRNDLVGTYPWVVGVKTGNTADAGECLVAAAKLNGVRLISVVLGTPSEAARDADTLALLRYGLSLYRSAQIAVRGRVYATLPVAGRARPARLLAERSSRLVLARSAILHVARDVQPRLHGPLAAGAVAGSLAVTENGRSVESVALVTADAVPAPRRRAARRSGAHTVRPVVWYAAGGGLALVLVGCSLPFMRRRATRSATGLES
jgi:D-alanyl-D-alanine carboxypeptidase (penicillin-binding protein 5/6)